MFQMIPFSGFRVRFSVNGTDLYKWLSRFRDKNSSLNSVYNLPTPWTDRIALENGKHQVKPCIEEYYKVYFELAYTVDYLAEKQKVRCNQVQAECKESQFWSLPFGQVVASMY